MHRVRANRSKRRNPLSRGDYPSRAVRWVRVRRTSSGSWAEMDSGCEPYDGGIRPPAPPSSPPLPSSLTLARSGGDAGCFGFLGVGYPLLTRLVRSKIGRVVVCRMMGTRRL